MEKQVVKLVITGPVNAGKTTLISHISNTPVITTDEVATDHVAAIKKFTTVAMDHGILYVDDELELHLFGTPGQRRFNFMWDVLATGASGVVFLTDGSQPESIDEMKHIFHHYKDNTSLPSIVGVTRQDVPGAATTDDVADRLDAGDTPVLPCDPRNKDDSKVLLLSLFELIMRQQADYAEEDFF